MTRLELLVAAVLLVAVCALSSAQPGYVDPAASAPVAAPSPLDWLLLLQVYSFQVAAAAVTLLALLLEDGRRRALSEHRPTSARHRPDSN